LKGPHGLCHKCAVNPRFRHPNTLPAWLDTGLGRSLVDAEARCLEELLDGFYGPVAVQVGEAGFGSYVALSGAAFRYSAAMGDEDSGQRQSMDLDCVPEQLPFEAKSVGLFVLPHVLEFSDHPHQILREVERVLMPEGHVVILGFNPLSMWGLARLFRRRRMPWNGRFASLSRVKDWLQLLNFELNAGRMVYHKPPLQSERLRGWLDFMERAGDRWWPLGGAVYVVVAHKREIGVTPLHPRWKKQHGLNPGLAKPVARAG